MYLIHINETINIPEPNKFNTQYIVCHQYKLKMNQRQTFPDFQFKTRVICLYLIIEIRRYKFTSVECSKGVYLLKC